MESPPVSCQRIQLLICSVLLLLWAAQPSARASAQTRALTARSGNWSSPQTWSPGARPGDGAAVEISHSVTVDAAVSVGVRGGTASEALVVARGAELFVAPGAVLTVRGDTRLSGGLLTLGAGSLLEFDDGARKLQIEDGGRLLLQGSASARCLVRLAKPQSGITSSIRGSGIIGEYCDLQGIGGVDTPAIDAVSRAGAPVSLKAVRFIGGGGLLVRSEAGGRVTLLDSTFRGTQAAESARLSIQASAALLDGNVFDRPVIFEPPSGAEISNNIFNEAYLAYLRAEDTGWSKFENNLIRNITTGERVLAGDSRNNYWLTDPQPPAPDNNPHFVQTTRWTASIDGDIFEYTGIDDNGDCISFGQPAAPTTTAIRRCIVLPNAGGNSSGTLFSALGSENVSIIAEHNTYFTGSQGAAVGETYPGRPGMLLSFRSNLAWDTGGRGHLLYDSGVDEHVVDLIHDDDLDHNNGYGLGGTYANLEFSTNGAGRHDHNADPRFVDAGRGIAAWDRSLGGPGSAAHAMQELNKRNDAAAYDSRFSPVGLQSFVRQGFVPRAEELRTAAHDGGTIGAVAFDPSNPPASPTAAPTVPHTPNPGIRPEVSVKGRTAVVALPPVSAPRRYRVIVKRRGGRRVRHGTQGPELALRRLAPGVYSVRCLLLEGKQVVFRSVAVSFTISPR